MRLLTVWLLERPQLRGFAHHDDHDDEDETYHGRHHHRGPPHSQQRHQLPWQEVDVLRRILLLDCDARRQTVNVVSVIIALLKVDILRVDYR